MRYKKTKNRILAILLTSALLMNGVSVLPVSAIEDVSSMVDSLMQKANKAIHTEAFSYALVTGNENTNLEMNAQKIDITGDVHSNSHFIYRGSEIIVNGACEAADDVTINVSDANYHDKMGSITDNTERVMIPDYSEEIYQHLLEQGVPEYYD